MNGTKKLTLFHHPHISGNDVTETQANSCLKKKKGLKISCVFLSLASKTNAHADQIKIFTARGGETLPLLSTGGAKINTK